MDRLIEAVRKQDKAWGLYVKVFDELRLEAERVELDVANAKNMRT